MINRFRKGESVQLTRRQTRTQPARQDVQTQNNNLVTIRTPEWAPIFTLREEDLRAVLGIITRIADGQGLASNSGVYGRRAYEGTHMFAWIGAAVDVPHLVYKVLGTLGQKLYFFRLPFKIVTRDNVNEELGSDFNRKFDSIQAIYGQ